MSSATATSGDRGYMLLQMHVLLLIGLWSAVSSAILLTDSLDPPSFFPFLISLFSPFSLLSLISLLSLLSLFSLLSDFSAFSPPCHSIFLLSYHRQNITCPGQSASPGSRYWFDETPAGQIARSPCQRPFSIVGYWYRKCLENGTWSPEIQYDCHLGCWDDKNAQSTNGVALNADWPVAHFNEVCQSFVVST